MKNPNKPLKHQFVLCVEGKAEDGWISFLKRYLRPNRCLQIEDMGGFSKFAGFEGKYNKILKKWNIKPKTVFSLIFIFDNDLGLESTKIQDFIITKGYKFFVTEPNIEGLFLKLKQKYKLSNDGSKQFRDKCKDCFKATFGFDAEDNIKDEKYHQILGSDFDSIRANAKICPNYTALLNFILDDEYPL